jgi:hypothetical protein
MQSTQYHISIYNRLPEEEPSVSKHVEDTKKLKIKVLIREGAFYWFMLYNCITMNGVKNAMHL